jgi:hypothetical protein
MEQLSIHSRRYQNNDNNNKHNHHHHRHHHHRHRHRHRHPPDPHPYPHYHSMYLGIITFKNNQPSTIAGLALQRLCAASMLLSTSVLLLIGRAAGRP